MQNLGDAINIPLDVYTHLLSLNASAFMHNQHTNPTLFKSPAQNSIPRRIKSPVSVETQKT